MSGCLSVLICLPVCLYLSVCLPVLVGLSVFLSTRVCLSECLCQSACMPVFVCLSMMAHIPLSLLFPLRIPICPVPEAVLFSEQAKHLSTKGLVKCFDPRCHTKPDWESCDGVVGCYWCVRDKNNAPLSTKYCADVNACYGGKERT